MRNSPLKLTLISTYINILLPVFWYVVRLPHTYTITTRKRKASLPRKFQFNVNGELSRLVFKPSRFFSPHHQVHHLYTNTYTYSPLQSQPIYTIIFYHHPERTKSTHKTKYLLSSTIIIYRDVFSVCGGWRREGDRPIHGRWCMPLLRCSSSGYGCWENMAFMLCSFLFSHQTQVFLLLL